MASGFPRTLLWLLALCVAQLALSGTLESARAWGWHLLTRTHAGAGSRWPAIEEERLTHWLRPDAAGSSEDGRAIVLERNESGTAWLALGSEEGVVRGALVLDGDSTVGFVDAVTPHLCRMRSFERRGARIPVEVVLSESVGNGARRVLRGALEGAGEGAVLTRMDLGREPPLGLPVFGVSLDGRRFRLGRIARGGSVPRVALALWSAGVVRVEGASDRAGAFAPEAAFETVPLDRHHHGEDTVALTLAQGDGERLGLGAGVAIVSGPWLLGRVRHRAGSLLLAEALGHGEPLGVVVRDTAGGEFLGRARVTGRRGGALLLDPAPPEGSRVLVASGGGAGRIPPGLVVALGTVEAGAVAIPDGRWPLRVEAWRFRFSEERSRLAGRRR